MSESPKRILVLTIRAIGDVTLMSPIFGLLKGKFPTAYLATLADGVSAHVLHHNPHIDRLFTIDRVMSRRMPWSRRVKEWIDLVSIIRRDRFNIVVDLFSGPRSAILAWLSGARDRYSEDARTGVRGFLYNRPIKIVRDGRHLVEQKLDLIRPLVGNIDRDATELEIYLTDKEKQAADSILARDGRGNRKTVGFVPGAGSNWRIWPAERFAELGNYLVKDFDADVYLLGGKEDSLICGQIADSMLMRPVDLSGKTTLRELIAVLAKLDLVISNVTGPLHLASALSKPRVIGLYGEADTVQYAPWSKNVLMVTKGSVENAYWKKVDYERDHEVLRQIEVKDVLEAVNKVMTR